MIHKLKTVYYNYSTVGNYYFNSWLQNASQRRSLSLSGKVS